MPTQTDILLIGAGPIGLEMAVALKQAGLSYLHVDKRQIGQTIWWYPPQTKFFSSADRIAIAGLPIPLASGESKCTREEYLAYLRTVVQHFDLPVRTYERVTNLQKVEDGFAATTQSLTGEETVHCRRVILAIGDMHRPNLLGVPGEDLPTVSHYFHDAHQYFQKTVLVVGGRNSAVEAALKCHHAGARVLLSYRRDSLDRDSIKYWLYPEISSLIKAGRIRMFWETEVERLHPGKAVLKQRDGKELELAIDFALLLTGFRQDNSLFTDLDLATDGPGQTPVLNPDTMESSIPGVYIAGTATAGSQTDYKVFIETSHIHVDRILAHLTGQAAPGEVEGNEQLES